jgi:hypothetical protein
VNIKNYNLDLNSSITCRTFSTIQSQVTTVRSRNGLYTEYIKNKPELLKLIPVELKGKSLGCWCKPLPCHGDVLAELADTDATFNHHTTAGTGS